MHDYSLAIGIIPLLVGVVLSQALRLNLKGFLGVYLLLVASNVAVSYLVLNAGWLAPLVIGAIGFVVIILMTGLFGTRVRTSDHVLAGIGVGLFPWTNEVTSSIVYAVIFTGFAILIALRPKFKNPLRRNRRS